MKKFYQITNKSFEELGVATQKEMWEKVKVDHKGLCACVNTVFTKAEDSENKFNVVMSTNSQDRHGDIVEQDWDLKNFKKNPVFLDSHNYNSIEHIIGKVNKIKVKDGQLVGEIEFALDNPKGMLAYNLASKGFLNATSVGFIPQDFSDDGKILKSELLEDSAVSVPANQEALFEKKELEKEEEKEEIKEEVKEEEKIEEAPRKNFKLEALKRLAEKQELKRKEILKEVLAVTQQLSKGQVEAQKRRQMANRIIKQLIKIK
jgi:HK97 family phage prohead protease